jgi:glycosyltransferase involved in cell wall biosynthesis
LIGRNIPETFAAEPGLSRESGLPPAAVAEALVSAAVVVLPSVHESFGLPALEALACGAPTVVSDIPAYREVTGGHALFVAGDTADAWSAALAHAIADPLDPGPGQRWAQRFSWSRCADETVHVLAAAMRTAPKPRSARREFA